MSDQPSSYEQATITVNRLRQDNNEQIALEINYPVYFVFGHSIVVAGVCVTLMALQIVMLFYKLGKKDGYSGIWVLTYLLIAMSLALLVS